MKSSLFLIVLIGLCASNISWGHTKDKPHILPDLPSTAMPPLIRPLGSQTSKELIKAKQIGERNLTWLKLINSQRSPSEQITLYDMKNRKGIPIDNPLIYNPQMVASEVEDYKTLLPAKMKEVLYDNKAFTDQLPTSLEDYTLWVRKVDKIYSRALRWELLSPYMDYLIEERRQDLRAYYFISKIPDIENKLADFNKMKKSEKQEMENWLLQLCFNDESKTIAQCKSLISQHIQMDNLKDYFNEFYPKAEKLWWSHFSIKNFRPDFQWKNSKLIAPFRDPGTSELIDFLKYIELEWDLNPWKIELQFSSSADVHLEMVPGVTPHVNELGGNKITMDADVPLLDPLNTLVLQHEFGHVLGFTDCYLEFFDDQIDAIVTYQLDDKNLMCSLAGNIQSVHFDELQRVY